MSMTNSMKTDSQPHVRFTPEQVKQLWDQGHLKVSGYVYMLLSARKQHGWSHKIASISDFCDEWGIKKRSFYQAKSLLITQGLLSEEIPGEIMLKTSAPCSKVIGIGDSDESAENCTAVQDSAQRRRILHSDAESCTLEPENCTALQNPAQRPDSNPTTESVSESPQLFIRSSSTFNSDLLHEEGIQKKSNLESDDLSEEPNSTPINSQSGQIETVSVGSKKTTVPRADLQIFIDCYNENKPDIWCRAEKLTTGRQKALKAFVKIHGSESAEVFQEALAYARRDKWASTHDLTFDNFMTNDKPTSWAEKYQASVSQPSVDNSLRQALLEVQNGQNIYTLIRQGA